MPPMIRQFRARVHVFSMEQKQLAAAECLLSVELAPFTATRWWGLLSQLAPVVPPPGRYLLRLPNGRVREIELGVEEFAGAPFTGFGTLPMP